jgi:hypothetical protein
MQIGVDASGKFLIGPEYEATVVAAAIGPDSAFAQIGTWTAEALDRWGKSEEPKELHANELGPSERLEVCRMLASRDDICLCAVVSDSFLLGSPAALKGHRERQYEHALNTPALTGRGRKRRDQVLAQLEGDRLTDEDYAFAVVLPLVGIGALQRAFGYFGGGEYRDDMSAVEVFVDPEAPPTKRYVEGTLLPTVSGDERFGLTLPKHWRKPPVHPFLEASMDTDGDGLRAEVLLGDMSWPPSEDRPAIQVADIAAWVIRRTLTRPEENLAREMFELLKPLLAGAEGHSFELFSTVVMNRDLEALYSHLRDGNEPGWWLRPAG